MHGREQGEPLQWARVTSFCGPWLFLGLVVHVFLAGALEDILDLSMQVLESDIPFLPQAGGFAAYLVLSSLFQIYENAMIAAGLNEDPRPMVNRLNELLTRILEKN